MVIAFEELRKLDEYLFRLKESSVIHDYRLILKLNMAAKLYVVVNQAAGDVINDITKGIQLKTEVTILTTQEFSEDEYYQSLFAESDTLDFGLRRSLSNIVEGAQAFELESCPIVSFYSYKGGVGRTTALALFASYYALIHSKKVFVIDCDFEAPGLINYFGINTEELPKNGIIEYLKDTEAGIDVSLTDNYVYEISKKYSGDGEIFLLPSGNIFDSIDRGDYLEALAKLDVHANSSLLNQFQSIIRKINDAYMPDVILIDSRTGFNDIFGIVGTKLSDIVVGFFGNNSQNRPGLHFFLETLFNNQRKINIITVLSIISSSFSRELGLFKEKIYDYIQTSILEDYDSMPALPIYCLSRYPSLEKIGTADEDPDDFITNIERRMLSDYNALFDKIVDQLSCCTINIPKGSSSQVRNDYGDDQVTASNVRQVEPEIAQAEMTQAEMTQADEEFAPTVKELKRQILQETFDHFPQQYAEQIQFSDDFLNSKFYFRRCMEDIFNHDKFLLLGGKGTGKTAFYQALREQTFFKNLIKRAQKTHLTFKVINIISMPNETERLRKFIDVAARFPQSEINDAEFFYRRFWEVYIWNAIRLEDQNTGYESSVDLPVNPIFDDNSTAEFFKNIIYNNNLFGKVENDLYDVDRYFKKNDIFTMIIFDQLDKVIKPNLWAKAISPLVRYAQTHSFARISPKLFVRRDLFNKLGNLTNKESLESQAINLEWTKDELFAFFFKVIFAYSQRSFLKYSDITGSLSELKKKEIIQKLNKPNSYNQLSPEEYLLRPLVEVFFGKYAGQDGLYGEMYDWLYSNLQNADGTISLRPFLDLIKYAIDKQYEKPELNYSYSPILSYKCFNADVREKAVERHFKDLAEEEGNENLRTLIYDIRNDRVPKELKLSPISQSDFEILLRTIIGQHDELKAVSLIELEEILKLNGILFVGHVSGGEKKYTFAYLYKYYLGLRSPKGRSRKRSSKRRKL